MCRPRRAPLVRSTRQGPEGARLAVVSRPKPASLAAVRASQVHAVILSGAGSDCKRKDRIIGRPWNNPEPMLLFSNSTVLGEAAVRPPLEKCSPGGTARARGACLPVAGRRRMIGAPAPSALQLD